MHIRPHPHCNPVRTVIYNIKRSLYSPTLLYIITIMCKWGKSLFLLTLTKFSNVDESLSNAHELIDARGRILRGIDCKPPKTLLCSPCTTNTCATENATVYTPESTLSFPVYFKRCHPIVYHVDRCLVFNICGHFQDARMMVKTKKLIWHASEFRSKYRDVRPVTYTAFRNQVLC